MRAFACGTCGQLVFFQNTACLNCGSELGFKWPERELLTNPEGLHHCANHELASCNWLVENEGDLCFACRLTRTRPRDGDGPGLAAFAEAENAKRWLVFELGELGLPLPSHRSEPGGLAFDFLSSEHAHVVTGHADGVITLDLAESDDARRTARREQLGEPYRTVLGHLRHEVGHFYFPRLVRGDDLERARELFGDERTDYEQALERHYESGPPADWQERYVSAYATMHPSEDWAETFAHYLHIRDAMQTAAAYRVRVLGPENAPPPHLLAELSCGPSTEERSFEQLLGSWLPLTYALNALTRSMGRNDLYPFVLSPPVIEKLGFVHEVVGKANGRVS